jgi:predicted kinase
MPGQEGEIRTLRKSAPILYTHSGMNKPKLYIITGLPYAGKSVLSRELVRRFNFGYASVDSEITKGDYDVTKMSQKDWNDVYSRAFDELEELLKCGKTTIFDGASLKRSERKLLKEIAQKCEAEPVLIYVNTSPAETAERRLKNMSSQERAHLKEETVRKAMAMFEEPAEDERPVIYNAGLNLNDWVGKHIKP